MNKFAVYKPYLFIIMFFMVPFLLFFMVKSFQKEASKNKFANQELNKKNDYAIVIHGGAGNIDSTQMTAEEISSYKISLYSALQKGINALEKGDSAVLVVMQVVMQLEDDSLFNAGKGSALTVEGSVEMDASIMDGTNLKAGAVASVSKIKNPINAAYFVMRHSPHVLLVGDGAESFAGKNGLEMRDMEYFITKRNLNRLDKWRNKKTGNHVKGTVGCVVLDKYGNLAAATSTGGMMGKLPGRVGDSPLIGAGTFADNKTCAVSATGHGEFFIRYRVAGDIAALMEYQNLSLSQSCKKVIQDKLKPAGGLGGVIALDNHGNICVEFSTTGMFRAYAKKNVAPNVKLFNKNDPNF